MHETIRTHLAQQDEFLAHIMTQVDWPQVGSTGNVFHDLMSCVTEQQIHYRSSKRSFARLLEKAGLQELTLENWEQFEEKGLSQAKLSGRKWETIAHVVSYFQQNDHDWLSMDDQEVRGHLSQISGVGPWTIDMVLIYTLNRPDVFPLQDYHLQRIMAQEYDIPAGRGQTNTMKLIAENWKPYRSFAVRYWLAWDRVNKTKRT